MEGIKMPNKGRHEPGSLTPAMEDYIEAILVIGEEKRNIRVKDVAKRLGVKMPTVTSMLKVLNRRGFIAYQKYEYLELTDTGFSIGREVRRRHRILRSFLTDFLKVDFQNADKEACRMEHIISASTLDTLVDFMEFMQICPRTGTGFLDHFEEYRQRGHDRDRCLVEMTRFVQELEGRIKMTAGIGKEVSEVATIPDG